MVPRRVAPAACALFAGLTFPAVVQAAPSLIRVGPAPRGGVGRVVLRPIAGGIAAPDRLRVRLNGRDVTRAFGGHRGLPHDAWLGATDGLHHGRNTLIVTAHRRDDSQRVRRTIVVPKGTPIPGAGADQTAGAGDDVRLDGTGSLARDGRHRARRLRWRIVRAPRGSRASLDRPTAARPRLSTDLPGTYRVALRVAHGTSAVAAAAGAADVVTVTTPAYSSPIGLPFETLATDPKTQQPAVRVSVPGQPYWDVPAAAQSQGAAFFVFDTKTLELLQTVTITDSQVPFFGVFDEAQLWQEFGFPSTTPSGAPVGIVGVVHGMGYIAQGALDLIGGNTATGEYETTEDINATMIGIYAGTSSPMPQNSATQSSLVGSLSNPSAGDIRGRLVVNSSGNYSFVATDAVPFDTDPTNQTDPGDTSRTSIAPTINGQTVGLSVPAGQSGFGVVVFDAGTAAVKASQAFAVNTGDTTTDATNQQAMANFLSGYAGDPTSLVLVQSIGAVKPTTPTWSTVAQQLAAFGASTDVFNRVNGGYSYVGGLWLPDVQQSSTTIQAGATGPATTEIVGILTRNNDFRLMPQQAGPVPDLTTDLPANWPFDVPDYSLAEIAVQKPTPWPHAGNRHYRQASQAIGAALGISPLPGPPSGQASTDVRLHYTDPTFSLSSLMTTVPKPCNKVVYANYPGLTKAVCLKQLKELLREEQMVAEVASMADLLQEPYQDGQSSQATFINTLGTTIDDALQEQANQAAATISWESIVADVLGLVTSVTGLGDGPITKGITALMSGAGYAFALGGDASVSSSGVPYANADLELGQLASQADQALQNALAGFDQLFDVLVTDYGRLTAANQGAAAGDPGFGLGPFATDIDQATEVTLASVKQSLSRSLLASVYPSAVQLPADDCGNQTWTVCNPSPTASVAQFTCRTGTVVGTHHYPFEDVPADDSVTLTTGFNSDMSTVTQFTTIGSGTGDDGGFSQDPPQGLVGDLLTTYSTSGSDLYAGWNPSLFVWDWPGQSVSYTWGTEGQYYCMGDNADAIAKRASCQPRMVRVGGRAPIAVLCPDDPTRKPARIAPGNTLQPINPAQQPISPGNTQQPIGPGNTQQPIGPASPG
jgi:hypothetical protein